MNKSYLKAYLDGLMNMASSLSKSLGPSYILVDCYDKKEFEKQFKIEYSPTTQSFEDKLKEWFVDDLKAVESIIHWTNRYLKEEKIIYNVNQKDIEIFEKKTLFYIIDDMFILETKDYLITYILGNNE